MGSRRVEDVSPHLHDLFRGVCLVPLLDRVLPQYEASSWSWPGDGPCNIGGRAMLALVAEFWFFVVGVI